MLQVKKKQLKSSEVEYNPKTDEYEIGLIKLGSLFGVSLYVDKDTDQHYLALIEKYLLSR
jgi:hypothetical protein